MKVCIFTLGCKVNQYESDALALSLEQKGYEVITELKKADIYIINTCAVTNEAEKKSRQALARVKKLNKDAKILVCGCASQKEPKIFADDEDVIYVRGVKNKLELINHLEDKKNVDIEELSTIYDENYLAKPSKTRAYVKIQDGCNNFCSYCIIPYLRGRSRSRSIIEILNEVENLKEEAKEIVITGINITDYRIDGKPALNTLLNELSKVNVRIRLGSLEETLVDDDFLQTIINMKNLCPHFHLSLQSGSKSVLKRMNRHYTPQEFLDSVNKLRSLFNNPSISTDVIVGFPGENDTEFQETVQFIKKVGFSALHIFPYSKRSGTVAEKMLQVDGIVKKRRAVVLEKLNEKLKKNFLIQSKKYPHHVLIEEFKDGYWIGHTENFIKCYIDSKDICHNQFVVVKIKKPYLDGAIAKIIKK